MVGLPHVLGGDVQAWWACTSAFVSPVVQGGLHWRVGVWAGVSGCPPCTGWCALEGVVVVLVGLWLVEGLLVLVRCGLLVGVSRGLCRWLRVLW